MAVPTSGAGGAAVAFNPSLHPRAPKGSAAGGQFTAAKGSKSTQKKQAGKQPGTSKNAAAAKKARALATSVPFAELHRLTVLAGQGKKLTPKQMAIVRAGEQAHADHVAHMAAVRARAKAKTAAKRKAK